MAGSDFAFLLSFYNEATLLFFTFSLLYLLKDKAEGAIKITLLLTLRGIINPGVAVEYGSLQIYKLMLMTFCCAYLCFFINRIKPSWRNRLKFFLIPVVIFLLFNILISFFFSSLPLIGVFKTVNFGIAFCGVLIGIAYSKNRLGLIEWILNWYKLLIFASAFFLAHPVGYLTNGWSFQGMINHPNVFGITTVLMISLLLGKLSIIGKMNLAEILFLVFSFFMILLSHSRTSFLSVLMILLLFFFSRLVSGLTHLKVVAMSFTGIFIITVFKPLIPYLLEFLSKGQTLDNFLLSREVQIKEMIANIQRSPLFGNGFGVPVLPLKSYEFSLNYVVEPGNLILAVLSFSGMIGAILFFIYMLQIFLFNKVNLRDRPFLYFSPLLISMGEMVFFSPNNIGVFCYFSLGMYMFSEKKNLSVEMRQNCNRSKESEYSSLQNSNMS